MTVFSISDDRLRDLAQDALNVARSVGASDASCEVSETTGLSVTVRKRKVETIEHTRDKGLGVIFITHNPHHAYPVGDRFLLLNRGASIGNYEKNQVTRDELTGLMAGGSELEQLSHELESAGGAVADLGRSMEEDVEGLGISQPTTTTTTTTTTESDAR
jgi:simple sugar transport system ATP-binding protein